MAIARVAHLANIDVGIRVHMRKQLLFLRDQGYDVYAVCPRGQFITSDGPTEDGIPVKLVNYTSAALTPLHDAKAVVHLIRYFRASHFDIVHTHGLKPGLLGRLAARIVGIPIVIHTIHGLFFHEGMTAFQKRFWAGVERIGMRLGDHALSQNQEDIETAVEMGICPRDRIGYLGNGIDLSVFNPHQVDRHAVYALRREMNLELTDRVVCLVGRLLVEKGYLEFFEAAKEIRRRRPEVHFWVVGPAQPQRPGTLSRGHPAVTEARRFVQFLGMRSDIPELLAASDVFVLPSHGREGVPRALMEAAAMERPIVATNVRGCREVVHHEVTGLLVPPRDWPQLAAAILRLVDNREEAARLGSRAGELARHRFDENDYCRRLADCYGSLLKKRLPKSLRAA